MMSEILLAFSLAYSAAAAAQDSAAKPAVSQSTAAPKVAVASTTATPAPAPAVRQPVARRHTILFFTASWCPACLQMKSQTLPNVSLPGHELRMIDIDANPQLGQSYGIQSLPAYVVLDGLGRAYRHGVGFRDVTQFVSFLNGR